MKFIISLCFLNFLIQSIFSDDCEKWPENLQTLSECCKLETISPESNAEKYCNNRIPTSVNDTVEWTKKMENCFQNFSNLITSDRKINKTVLAAKYHDYIFEASFNVNPAWAKLVPGALDKCELESSESLNRDLANFFFCIREYLQNHCVSFKFAVGCDEVEEHFNKCNKIEPDCSLWTAGHSGSCCGISPPVISNEITEICATNCHKSEFFMAFRTKCFIDCLANETSILRDDKLDFEALKKLMFDNSNKTAEWEVPIGKAVDKCESLLKGEYNNNLGKIVEPFRSD